MAKNLARTGEQAFQKMDKINAEVFTLTYGAMVQQLLKVEPPLESKRAVSSELVTVLPSTGAGSLSLISARHQSEGGPYPPSLRCEFSTSPRLCSHLSVAPA